MPSRLPAVVLVGRPNVGKSTLFNRLTRTRRAIVTAIPGTTRDVIALEAEWRGRRFQLVDTGGMFGASEDPLHALVFERGQRALAEADLLVLANDHWNFNVRDFNSGGNHGSFFRTSTHSTLMLAGGARSGIPRANQIEEPYDSLSFAPTIFALLGQLPNGESSKQLRQRGFQNFPGRVIKEVLSP